MSKRSDQKKWTTISHYYLCNGRRSHLKKDKMVRVSECIKDSNSNIFVDIREFDCCKPSKKGICFTLDEFKHILRAVRVRGRNLSFGAGKREVSIEWINNSIIINLKTAFKRTIYNINHRELRALVNKFRFVQRDLDRFGLWNSYNSIHNIKEKDIDSMEIDTKIEKSLTSKEEIDIDDDGILEVEL
jgi:hypothetical protein